MGKFNKFRVCGKKKDHGGRGANTFKMLLDIMKAEWYTFQESLEEDDNLRNELIEHFNTFIPGEEDLGAILYGDLPAFEERVKYLDDDTAEKYTKELEE